MTNVTPAPTGLRLKPPDPDQLDRMLRVTSPFGWLAVLVLAMTLAAAVVWSILGTVPVKVAGRGILLPSEGVVDVVVPASGRLVELLVREGDTVRAGQTVARLLHPELDNQLIRKQRELDALAAEMADRRALHAREDEVHGRLLRKQMTGLQDRIGMLESRVRTLNQQRDAVQGLHGRGFAPLERLLGATADAANAEKELADARAGLVQLETQEEERRTRARRETLELEMRIAATERERENLEGDRAERSTVRAPADGVVVEEIAGQGDIPAPGAPILRLLPGTLGDARSAVTAVVFVPPEDGKKVRAGMTVQVIPSVVKAERDGFILGTVTQVADLPASREKMTALLRNNGLVEQLSIAGSPYMALVVLSRDPAAPSGFQWSTGRGPDRPIDVGTLVKAQLVVDRVRVIALVVPQIETVLRRLGL